MGFARGGAWARRGIENDQPPADRLVDGSKRHAPVAHSYPVGADDHPGDVWGPGEIPIEGTKTSLDASDLLEELLVEGFEFLNGSLSQDEEVQTTARHGAPVRIQVR